MSEFEILEQYKTDVGLAYEHTREAKKNAKDPLVTADKSDTFQASKVTGALITAAGKRALRDFYKDALQAELCHKKIDITATNISKSMIRVIGRKASTAWIVENFATAGRTAANKSDATENEFAGFEERTARKVADFKQKLQKIRDLAKNFYLSSAS